MKNRKSFSRCSQSQRLGHDTVLRVCVLLCVLNAVAFAADKGLSAPLQQGNYSIERYVIASGGPLAAISTHYVHLGTAGQTIVDACQSANYIVKSGIWQLPAISTGVARPLAQEVPTAYFLYQNFPNPFNPLTVIRFDVPVSSQVSLVVVNVLGEEVARLVSERKEPGSYEARFDASYISSGVYFYRMQADEPSFRSGQSFVQTRKLILLK
jgi:hypothetical protein